jgi:hypothetical protein
MGGRRLGLWGRRWLVLGHHGCRHLAPDRGRTGQLIGVTSQLGHLFLPQVQIAFGQGIVIGGFGFIGHDRTMDSMTASTGALTERYCA